VHSALDRDPKVATKLVESNRNLEWIKACKDQQGSVEQSSLTMVSKINLTGVYYISMPDRKGDESHSTNSTESFIKMSYHKVENQRDGQIITKDLSLEDLQELR
jgi:hypothetical protein